MRVGAMKILSLNLKRPRWVYERIWWKELRGGSPRALMCALDRALDTVTWYRRVGKVFSRFGKVAVKQRATGNSMSDPCLLPAPYANE